MNRSITPKYSSGVEIHQRYSTILWNLTDRSWNVNIADTNAMPSSSSSRPCRIYPFNSNILAGCVESSAKTPCITARISDGTDVPENWAFRARGCSVSLLIFTRGFLEYVWAMLCLFRAIWLHFHFLKLTFLVSTTQRDECHHFF